MSEELLPCPFCGSDAEEGASSADLFYVGCTDCGATVYAQMTEMAVENWNTRPDSKPYTYATEDDLQEAMGWYTSEFQEAISFAFNAARERKEG